MSIFITRDKMSAEDKYYKMMDKQTIKHPGRDDFVSEDTTSSRTSAAAN
jgi:hypothetical protein